MSPTVAAWVPTLNAGLIVVSGLFAALGYVFIRSRRIAWHRRSMLTAAAFAALFLIVYVTRALLLPTKLFAGEGLLRAVYLAILGSHMILAIAVGPLVLATLRLALRQDYKRHRRIARFTLPIWLYVVLSGWTVYLMLYAW
ncbi:MAG: DUF420 domain-containing protein [Chloroflexi bacterium]|nr:DUF420 domain-containing protein [Chloroflexota bacterium]